MTLGRRHWLVAAAVAVLLHLSLLALVLADASEDGAKAPGERGVEIDLGMLGDLGEASETVEETVADTEPAVEPQAEPPEPQPAKEPQLQPQPDPVVAPEPPPPAPKQEPVVQAKREPPPKPKQKQPEPRPEPEPGPEPVRQPVQPSPPSTVQTDSMAKRDAESQQAQRKQSSGRAGAATSGGNPAARQSWYAQLTAELARQKRYPTAARRRAQEGVAELTFVVNRKGDVLKYEVSGSSGYKLLDRAVIEMLLNARPLPPFPPGMLQDEMTITLPVQFSLRSG